MADLLWILLLSIAWVGVGVIAAKKLGWIEEDDSNG